MKYFDWSEEKNKLLKKIRNISFEEILLLIENGHILDIVENNNTKYQNQKIFIIEKDNHAYNIPFVEDEKKYFLKTIYPSRYSTKKYLKKK